MRNVALLSLFLFVLLPQCTEKTSDFLKRRLINEGIMGGAASLSVLEDSKKERENEYVVRVSGDDLKLKQVVREKFKKIGGGEKGELNLVEHRIGGKWLASKSNWRDEAYVWISDKDGTLIYLVILSPNESIIFLSYR